MNRRGTESGELFVVSAPSGAGKTTLCKIVCENLDNLVYSVSYTTRRQRPEEVDGRDYYFIDESKFEQMVLQDEFVEWAEVHGNRYGTSRPWLTERLGKGLDVILDVDVQGAMNLKKTDFPCRFVFVLPPSWEALERRLRGRGTETEDAIRKRLAAAERELEKWPQYDYILINETVAETAKDLESIIRSARSSLERKRQWVRDRFDRFLRKGSFETPPAEDTPRK